MWLLCQFLHSALFSFALVSFFLCLPNHYRHLGRGEGGYMHISPLVKGGYHHQSIIPSHHHHIGRGGGGHFSQIKSSHHRERGNLGGKGSATSQESISSHHISSCSRTIGGKEVLHTYIRWEGNHSTPYPKCAVFVVVLGGSSESNFLFGSALCLRNQKRRNKSKSSVYVYRTYSVSPWLRSVFTKSARYIWGGFLTYFLLFLCVATFELEAQYIFTNRGLQIGPLNPCISQDLSCTMYDAREKKCGLYNTLYISLHVYHLI